MAEPKDILVLVNTPGFEPAYEVIFDCARRHNWRLSIEERLNPPKGWRGDGALVLSVDYPAVQRYIRRLRRLGIPVVDIELSRSTRICNRCLFDIRAASELVSEHFKALGFRHAAFFAMESLYLREAQNRIFADVWNDRCESWIRKGRAVRDWDSVDDWARRLLSAAPKPIAVVTPNSYNAARLLDICLGLGLCVPEEVSITSLWYQEKFSEGRPIRISGVRFDETRRTRESVEMLARLVDGERGVPEEVLIPPDGLEILESSDVYAARSPVLREAFRCIRENLAKPIDTAEIAAEVGVSRSTLDRLFAAEIGHSAGAEVKRMRITRAKRLLRTTDLKLDAVAAQCGLCHSSYLIRMFKSATGVTPHAFRAAASG